jgi:hypothetical protein
MGIFVSAAAAPQDTETKEDWRVGACRFFDDRQIFDREAP